MVEHELMGRLLVLALEVVEQADPVELEVLGLAAHHLQQGGHDVHLGGGHLQLGATCNATCRPPYQHVRLAHRPGKGFQRLQHEAIGLVGAIEHSLEGHNAIDHSRTHTIILIEYIIRRKYLV